jgi:hypothetical protein
MKKCLASLLFASLAVSAALPAHARSSHSVSGYVKKNGTYVAPHRQTDSDSSRVNNWSSKGNFNPYTGKKGTRDPCK